jgi:DNA-binding transcriptional ArsR family regulator
MSDDSAAVLDYELDDEIPLDTPERIKAVAEPVRMLILDLVLEQAMSVTDLARRTGKPKGTIAHHVEVLVDVGLLKVVRTRKVRAMEERFYGRVARTVTFVGGPDRDTLPFFDDAIREADFDLISQDFPSGFTLRHARIPRERADEWNKRIHDLALEFSRLPRGGDVEYALLVGIFPTNRPVAPRPSRKKVAS